MIDEKRLEELNPSGFSVDEWREMIETLQALWKENAELRGISGNRLDLWMKVSMRNDVLEAVARAAELLNEREPKIAEICGIAQALAALKEKP